MNEKLADFDEYLQYQLENRLSLWTITQMLFGRKKIGCTAREFMWYIILKPWADWGAILLLAAMIVLVSNEVWGQYWR